jgi:hypothetical protein
MPGYVVRDRPLVLDTLSFELRRHPSCLLKRFQPLAPTFCGTEKRSGRGKPQCVNSARQTLHSGLPDGIFSNRKAHFGEILEGLAIEDVGTFFVIWSILRPFGVIYDHLVYFPHFVLLCQEKYGNPDCTDCWSAPGLPDLSWYSIPKWENISAMTTKYPKCP